MSVTNSPDPVDAIVDILQAEDTNNWSLRKPSIIKSIEQTSPKDRENTEDDAIYVRGPGLDIERFSADPNDLMENGTAEILIYSLDKNRATQHTRDIIDFLREYMNDNYTQTDHHHIVPSGTTDNRQSKITRRTDHFVSLVEVELHRISS
jgi:hypothetical protein